VSAKIKLSYETKPELLEVIARLGGDVDKVKLQPPKGKYSLAYIQLKPLRFPAEKRIIEQ
jgi:hypothetical protein